MAQGFARVFAGMCLVGLAVVFAGCDKEGGTSGGGGSSPTTAGSGGPAPKVAFVTNGIDPFWDTAVAGARVGAKEFNLNLEIQKPPKGVPDQNRILQALIAKGTQG